MSRQMDMHGFTLVELMITLVLLSIVAVIAVPNFTSFITNNRTQAQAEGLKSFLQYARSEAVLHRATATITIDDEKPWELKKGTELLRNLEHTPAQTEILASVDTLAFHANGTATAARFTVCHDNEPANGFLIEVKASGATLLYRKGTKDLNKTALTSCTP